MLCPHDVGTMDDRCSFCVHSDNVHILLLGYVRREMAIQTHFYQPCGDPFHGAPPDAQRQSYSERYRPESFQGRVSDRREIPSNQMPPSPGDGLVKRGLFTGLTPLSASTQHPLFPGRQEVEGGTTGPSTGQTGLKERSTAMTSSTHTAVSTTTIGPTPATSTTMDPKDVATTVHTIAKDYRSKDDRPPAPGLMLISKRKKSNDSIASDILVPTDQVTTGKTTTSASGVTSATSATTHPSATTRTTTTGTTRTGTTP
ncbi:hypothetical protein ANCCEY_03567 [Ancylostoma ceylanicum]|uniref:Uncharacterized protein n=1 Tax=Ancylostoma ceylanicum TaxID=53326 RepID=A0A0D6MB18_9BILA|nr:hypothetical protein ANCCEY_03567 [Ancylostoma ceylanicum]